MQPISRAASKRKLDLWHGHPDRVVLIAHKKRNQFPFRHKDGPGECWAWVLDMMHEDDAGNAWVAFRADGELVLIYGPSDSNKWGTA